MCYFFGPLFIGVFMILNLCHLPFFRSSFRPHPLLCWHLWRCQWWCECHCKLDTEWWGQCWFLPHQHHHQRSPDPIWRTSEYHWQCHTASTDWFLHRLCVQHYSTWCQLWKSGGGWKWAPDNYSTRYVDLQSWLICRVAVEKKKGHESLLLWALC